MNNENAFDGTTRQRELVDLIARYEAAFNANDVQSMNALFYDESVFVNFNGDLVTGRRQLYDAQADAFGSGGPLAGVRVEYVVERIVFLTAGIAIVHTLQRTPAPERFPGGEDPMRARFMVVTQRDAEGWRIRVGQNTPLTRESRQSHLWQHSR